MRWPATLIVHPLRRAVRSAGTLYPSVTKRGLPKLEGEARYIHRGDETLTNEERL